ncbi:DUF4097 family beta strand repeat-containing protein [Streptomyces sp. NBC_00239]|uniref:DUF4097 family beta strand repeat-containing protein n=1 Tax=Streptomyces sp. NBC_00239 TaxID=2903640 RepID=UPI002E2C80F7|nr:DUF4097 family beta strand repeat-containing protein [Streptomyces sp. NBC_00239]
MQHFDTAALISAVLDIPAGHVRIEAGERADATVEVVPADASNGSDVKAAEQIEVAYADGVLRVEAPAATSRILGSSGSVAVTVQLPVGSHIEAKSAAGDFRGVGRLGDVAYEGAQGTVEIEEAAGARIVLQSGDVSVGRLGGSADIATQQGAIRIAEASKGTVKLTTQHGEIAVGAARGVSASLDAGTSYGRIDNALTNTDGASAALNIHATTSYGDITARSL